MKQEPMGESPAFADCPFNCQMEVHIVNNLITRRVTLSRFEVHHILGAWLAIKKRGGKAPDFQYITHEDHGYVIIPVPALHYRLILPLCPRGEMRFPMVGYITDERLLPLAT